MRGQWFIDGTWQPLEEEESNLNWSKNILAALESAGAGKF